MMDKFSVDFQKGVITCLQWKGVELIYKPSLLFTVRLIDRDGNKALLHSDEYKEVAVSDNKAVYSFDNDISVEIRYEKREKIEWRIDITNGSDYLIEWINYPNPILQPLVENDGIGRVLFPYNEGCIASDISKKKRYEPEYPSLGWYAMFPNMVFSQFICYLFGSYGLYIAAEDSARCPKNIDYYEEDGGTSLLMRVYCGTNYGDDYKSEFPVVWQFFNGNWYDGANIYREWLKRNLPIGMQMIKENKKLPSWYIDSPLILAYPVRGNYDTDVMSPNKLFPYINAAKYVEEIAKKTGCRIMALIMHWESTAPWAPPYVWPPFGGVKLFNEFRDYLHENGHLLGVYCSGFGWTLRSNLIKEYDKSMDLAFTDVAKAFCKGPGDKLTLGNICPDQRIGYDLCLKPEKTKEILNEAYLPLFNSGVDYAQILDQNHGGGQYFCYASDHGHNPCPGKWMTEEMQKVLTSWSETVDGKMLFGCESAAAEPFIPNLLFSDNRFELNYFIGTPVPLYSYIFHEYVRNFMGNQVCGFFEDNSISVEMRLAYSFCAGDSLTLVLTENGEIAPFWGCRDFSALPCKEKILKFISALREFADGGVKNYLYCGKMIKRKDYKCRKRTIRFDGSTIETDCVFSSAWECEGTRIQIFVNYNDNDEEIVLDGQSVIVEKLSALSLKI